MTKEEAWKIVEECRDWNAGQMSYSFIVFGERTTEDDVFDAKRAALKKAWEVIEKGDDTP